MTVGEVVEQFLKYPEFFDVEISMSLKISHLNIQTFQCNIERINADEYLQTVYLEHSST